jgi:thiamine biosynthesis lipoprotein
MLNRQSRPGCRIGLALALAMVLACVACQPGKAVTLSGQTMGTTYHVTVIAGPFTSSGKLQAQIDHRLAQINASMSTYDPTSEISRFNAIGSTTQTFAASTDFHDVLQVASKLRRLTDGAWDGTLDPLITLWGFGRTGTVTRIPDDAAIQQALAHVGFERIQIDPSGVMRKIDPMVTLDLASIAKGFGVDAIARLLGERGFEHFLVEIGGEVYARGHRLDGRAWQVGINRPQRGASASDVYKVVPLSDQAMATSGDYRIFFEVDGQFYSHVLDPRSGRPVTNGVVSATVVAANCTVADGLATALMVMGPQKGLELVDRLATVACLIVVRQPDGRLIDYPSARFVLR